MLGHKDVGRKDADEKGCQAEGGRTPCLRDENTDASRDPAETLAFAGVKPGMTVVELFPGGGYFTRMIVDVVGPKGAVTGIENAGWKGAAEAEMSEEMRTHLRMQVEANLAAGMDPDDARHRAQRQFGHLEGIKEVCRDVQRSRRLETVPTRTCWPRAIAPLDSGTPAGPSQKPLRRCRFDNRFWQCIHERAARTRFPPSAPHSSARFEELRGRNRLDHCR